MKINTLSYAVLSTALFFSSHNALGSNSDFDYENFYARTFATQRTGDPSAQPEEIDIKVVRLQRGDYETYDGTKAKRRTDVALACLKSGDVHTLDIELARRAIYKTPDSEDLSEADIARILLEYKVSEEEVDNLHKPIMAKKAEEEAKRKAEEEAAAKAKAEADAASARHRSGDGGWHFSIGRTITIRF